MQGRSPWPGAVAEGKVLAGAAIDLYENENRWRQAQQWGIDIVNNRFSKNKHGSLLRQRIKKVREQLDAHRRENFTGAMLQHHRAAASKYMGRWITLKNEQQELGEGH